MDTKIDDISSNRISYFIIHTGLLVAKIKSCIPRALWQGGQYYKHYPRNLINIARALCDKSSNFDLRLQYVVRIHSSENAPPTLVTVATSHKLSLSCDDKMAAGSHLWSLDSKMTHNALYE